MKRIIMMLALAAFLVAALSVSALSAFADINCAEHPDHPNCTEPTGASGKPLKEQQIQTVGEKNKNAKPATFEPGHASDR